jgi:hypothetical protein
MRRQVVIAGIRLGPEAFDRPLEAELRGGVLDPLAGGDRVARRDQIAPAQLEPVHAQRVGQPVHHAFVGDGHLAGSEPAHRPRRVVVGMHPVHVHLDAGHPVGAGRVAGSFTHHRDPGGRIRPLVGIDHDAGGGQASVGVGGQSVFDLEGVPLVPGAHRLRPIVTQRHRLARMLQRSQPEVNLNADILAPAERAAGGGLDDADLLYRNSQREPDQPAFLVNPLTGGVEGEQLPVPDAGARLHVEKGVIHRLGVKGLADHAMGGRQRRIHVAAADALVAHDVAFGVEARRIVRQGVVHGRDNRQRGVLDRDALAGGFGGSFRFGDHHGQCVTAIAHPPIGQGGMVAANQPVQVGAADVRMGVNPQHAGNGQRSPRVDADDVGVGVFAAQYLGEQIGCLREQVGAIHGHPGDLVGPVDAAATGADQRFMRGNGDGRGGLDSARAHAVNSAWAWRTASTIEA